MFWIFSTHGCTWAPTCMHIHMSLKKNNRMHLSGSSNSSIYVLMGQRDPLHSPRNTFEPCAPIYNIIGSQNFSRIVSIMFFSQWTCHVNTTFSYTLTHAHIYPNLYPSLMISLIIVMLVLKSFFIVQDYMRLKIISIMLIKFLGTSTYNLNIQHIPSSTCNVNIVLYYTS